MNEEGEYLGVKYAELVPVLIRAVQEQESTISILRNELAELKTMMVSLANSENYSSISNQEAKK